MSTKAQALSLYRSLIRESGKFPAYNYRNYALRRVRDDFRKNKDLTDPNQIKEQITQGFINLESLRRQVLIGQLYRTDKLIIENVSPKT